MRVPSPGEAVPKRGNALSRALGRAILAAFGWRIEGVIPDVPKVVVILAPHTSNWDFLFGLAAILALGIDVRWLGKQSIFRPPFRRLLRFLGGIPVDRRDAADVVVTAVGLFRESDRLFLGLAPEGTRSKVEKWKSGFYRIAEAAGIAIFPAALDYRVKAVVLQPLFAPTGDYPLDLAAIQGRYTKEMARHPEMY